MMVIKNWKSSNFYKVNNRFKKFFPISFCSHSNWSCKNIHQVETDSLSYFIVEGIPIIHHNKHISTVFKVSTNIPKHLYHCIAIFLYCFFTLPFTSRAYLQLIVSRQIEQLVRIPMLFMVIYHTAVGWRFARESPGFSHGECQSVYNHWQTSQPSSSSLHTGPVV